MIKRILFISLLLLSGVACAGKLAPGATAAQQANLMRLNVASAVDDSVDGIIAAHNATWLNDRDTILVLKSLHVALETIKTSPDPKTTILSALIDIKKQLPSSSLSKWNPYLDSLSSVVGAF